MLLVTFLVAALASAYQAGQWRRWGTLGTYLLAQRRRCRVLADACLSSYDRSLRLRPVTTKMATSAVVEVFGDVVAQRLAGGYEARRSRAVCVDGLLTGFVLHHVYGLQERRLPPSHLAWWVPFFHIFVDECLVDPCFCVGFIAITDCHWDRLLPTLAASKAVSLTTLPVQWANFRFAPVRYRVFVVNLIDVVWTAAVSLAAHAGS